MWGCCTPDYAGLSSLRSSGLLCHFDLTIPPPSLREGIPGCDVFHTCQWTTSQPDPNHRNDSGVCTIHRNTPVIQVSTLPHVDHIVADIAIGAKEPETVSRIFTGSPGPAGGGIIRGAQAPPPVSRRIAGFKTIELCFIRALACSIQRAKLPPYGAVFP